MVGSTRSCALLRPKPARHAQRAVLPRCDAPPRSVPAPCRCGGTGGATTALQVPALWPRGQSQLQQKLQQRRQQARPVQRRQRARCRAAADQQQNAFSKFASQAYLDNAARRFRVGLENGLSEDELVAIELGAQNLDDLPEAQRPYVDKLKLRLAERAEQLRAEEAARRARELKWFEAGKTAYERGEYPDAVVALERAADEAGRMSSVGGDALMWLALAYQAVGRETDCIDTYKWIEANHPLPKTRKQAENLRYIMEAPRLELSPDERVTIPLLNSQDVSWRRDGRKSSYKPKGGGAESGGGGSYWDRALDGPKLDFAPDKWYVRVAWAVLLAGVTAYVNFYVPR